MQANSINPTLEKFGYPDTVIQSYQHWSVLLRVPQATLGSCILAAHSDATAFGQLSSAEFGELASIVKSIETTLTDCFHYDKINYLMLMMVDPNVHFHVVPRYKKERVFATVTCFDASWPGPPDLSRFVTFENQQLNALMNYLRQRWVK